MDLKELHETIKKWQNEIGKTLDDGGTIKIKKANENYVIYKEIIKKIK